LLFATAPLSEQYPVNSQALYREARKTHGRKYNMGHMRKIHAEATAENASEPPCGEGRLKAAPQHTSMVFSACASACIFCFCLTFSAFGPYCIYGPLDAKISFFLSVHAACHFGTPGARETFMRLAKGPPRTTDASQMQPTDISPHHCNNTPEWFCDMLVSVLTAIFVCGLFLPLGVCQRPSAKTTLE